MKFTITMSEMDGGKLMFRHIETFDANFLADANLEFDSVVSDLGDKAASCWLRMSRIDGGNPIVIRQHGSMQNVLNSTNPSK